MLCLSNVAIHIGQKLLFEDVNLTLTPGNRYGIIGANGAGKSTLLKMIAGVEECTLGEITTPKNTTLGWMKQDQFLYQEDTVVNAVIRGNSKLWDALHGRDALLETSDFSMEDCEKLSEFDEIITACDGYEAQSQAETLLTGLGIVPEKQHKPLSELSGGYKIRVLLAQTLFARPDILLLDEPTNHLDISSIIWLEGFLKRQFKGMVLFVSHDQGFLNNIATHTLDIDYGEITLYHGNYDALLIQKEQIMEGRLSEKRNLEDKVERMQRFVDKFKAKASKAKQAMSRAKMIEKIELPDIKKSSRIAPYFRFEQQRPSGKSVLEVDAIAKEFGNHKLFKNVSFSIRRGEKVALVGKNGIGKSTLVKILLKSLKPTKGEITYGHEVYTSYIAQDLHELLEDHLSVYEWLCSQVRDTSQVRNVLGSMLFGGNTVHHPIGSISGGEAAKLLFAKVILEQPNFLVLDEPTNHLDMESINALAAALKKYPGTVLVVSHNRHFINKFVTRVLTIQEDHAKEIPLKDLDTFDSE